MSSLRIEIGMACAAGAVIPSTRLRQSRSARIEKRLPFEGLWQLMFSAVIVAYKNSQLALLKPA
jgi:hypothetical protein